jgi:hypothetical protein
MLSAAISMLPIESLLSPYAAVVPIYWLSQVIVPTTAQGGWNPLTVQDGTLRAAIKMANKDLIVVGGVGTNEKGRLDS